MADQSIPNLGRGWCPECGQTRDIEDQFIEDTGDSRVVVEVYSVTVFDCGHSTTVLTNTYRSTLQQAGPTPAMQRKPEGWEA